MGFIAPAPPSVDVEEWKRLPHLARIRPMAQDWAINGFGTPTAVFLLYVVKLVVFVAAAWWVIDATTPGPAEWTDPIFFQKVVVWLMLWEIVGLGCGSMPLTFRFIPPIGSILYWLRPGTVRLPPWPGRVPGTRGSTRTVFDVVLYGGVVANLLYLLLTDGNQAIHLDRSVVAVTLALLVALGLRDKVSFLASRPEIYTPFLVITLFPMPAFFVAGQLVFLCIWLGAASSKLNRHFPFVVSVMISNTPWNRSRFAKGKLYVNHPEDMRPSRYAAFAAHLGTAMELSLPLVLFFSDHELLGALALIGMIVFHTHITSTFPLAVPLEWNLFMIYGLLFLFGEYGDVPLSTLADQPLLLAYLLASCVALPVIGNFWPEKVSFLLAMRYYAGNWATSQWLFRKDTGAEARLDDCIKKSAPIVREQLVRLYDAETADYLLNRGLAFRSMHAHGRALNGLAMRSVDDIETYDVREGELVSNVVNGWNFGDGHFHDEQLLAAIQERCNYAPGDVRVVMLESQPAHVQKQRYRIHDAATGLIEEGWVSVHDMVARQPWLDGAAGEFPVEVAPSRA